MHSNQNKKDRDAFLIKHMDTSRTPKRKVTGSNNVTEKAKSVSTKYFIYTENRRKLSSVNNHSWTFLKLEKTKFLALQKIL